jgi:hypothetical protein
VGKSLPPPAAVDLVSSYARRRGADVEIVLADPKGELAEDAAIVLVKERRSVPATTQVVHDADGTKLLVRAPMQRLGNGLWSLRLGANRSAPAVDARLLVQGARPVVLLWGATAPESLTPVKHLRGRQRAAASAGQLLDKVLSVLPDEQAGKIREQARRAARRTLG